jgi:hypothetical protein
MDASAKAANTDAAVPATVATAVKMSCNGQHRRKYEESNKVGIKRGDAETHRRTTMLAFAPGTGTEPWPTLVRDVSSAPLTVPVSATDHALRDEMGAVTVTLVGEMPSGDAAVRDDVMVGDGRVVARLNLGGTGVDPPPFTIDVRVVGEKFNALAACAAVTLGRDSFDMDDVNVALVTMDEARDKVGDGGVT